MCAFRRLRKLYIFSAKFVFRNSFGERYLYPIVWLNYASYVSSGLALSNSFELRTASVQLRPRAILLTLWKLWEEKGSSFAHIDCAHTYLHFLSQRPPRAAPLLPILMSPWNCGLEPGPVSRVHAALRKLPRFGTRGNGRNDNISMRSNLPEHAVAIRWMENITVVRKKKRFTSALTLFYIRARRTKRKKSGVRGGNEEKEKNEQY